MAVSAARDYLAEAIEQARTSGEPVYVTRRDRRVAVIVDADAYDSLVEAAEDALIDLTCRPACECCAHVTCRWVH